MKQMITRLDDELHARIKAQADAEGRSVNELVVQVLSRALGNASSRDGVRERARATGRLVVPEPPAETVSRDEAIRSTRGLGNAVSTALEEERSWR
jgi:plasmid stability protein